MPTKWIYTPNQIVTIALDFLANEAIAISSPIDNSISGYMSMDLQIKVRTGSTVTTGGLYKASGVGIYLLRTVDGSTTGKFDIAGNVNTTTDNVNNPELLTVIFMPVINTTYSSSITVENMPAIFKLMAYNGTGGFLTFGAGIQYIKYNSKHLQSI